MVPAAMKWYKAFCYLQIPVYSNANCQTVAGNSTFRIQIKAQCRLMPKLVFYNLIHDLAYH